MLHGTRIASDESAFDLARPSHTAIGEPGSDGLITVPDAHLLFNGDFQRHGSDLKIVGEAGQSFLIPGYFKGEKNPTLLSPEGASLSGEIVEALAGPLAPGQYAQAGQQTSDQPAIGRIEQVAGNATIVRNGVAIAANQGDVVRKGDVVQTGGDGMIAVLFSDGSTFSLSANARMVLNDFVFQSGGSNNSALISLVQGTIGFVAGQVAKTGDMRVETPVATMGIRGTAVLVEISANDGQTKFSVMMEPDGTTGSFNLYDKSSGALLGTVNNSQVGWVVTPAGPLQVIAQQVQKSPGEVQQELNYFQQIFNIFNQGQQNPFVPEQRTDNPNPQNTNGTGTQFTINQPNNPNNPNGDNQPNIINVTITPQGNGNNNDNSGPLNNSSPLPGIFIETANFNVIHGSGIINGTPIRDIIFGSMGSDIIHADNGPDDVFALGGDDIILAGHGGGNDFYDGGDDDHGDAITYISAEDGVTFNLNAGMHTLPGGAAFVYSTAESASTNFDIFIRIEKIISGAGDDVFNFNAGGEWEIESGAGNDVFVLHANGEWYIDAGTGIDTVRFADGLDIFDTPGGIEVDYFEIVDLATDASQNIVQFDIDDFDSIGNEVPLRILGGGNDIIEITNYYGTGGTFSFVSTFVDPAGNEVVGDPFNDHFSDGVTFDVYEYVIDGQVVNTVYVEQGVQISGLNEAPQAGDVTLDANVLGNGDFESAPDFEGWTVSQSTSGLDVIYYSNAFIDRSGSIFEGDDAVAVLSFSGAVPVAGGTGSGPSITSDAFAGYAGNTIRFVYQLSAGTESGSGDLGTVTGYIVDAETGAVVQTFTNSAPLGQSTGMQTVNYELEYSGEFQIKFEVGSIDSTYGYVVGAQLDLGFAGIIQIGVSEDAPFIFAENDLLANSSDADGDALSIASVATSSNGALVFLNEDGSVTYDPTGSAIIQALGAGETMTDTFTFTVKDEHGAVSGQATATVTVQGANDAPTTVDVSASGDEDEFIPVTLMGSDVDGIVNGFKLLDLPTDIGTLYYDELGENPVGSDDIIDAVNNSATLYFRPEQGFTGQVVLDYAAIDNEGDEDASPATITIDIAAAEESAGDVTVTVATNDGFNIEQFYDQLFDSEVQQISASHIVLRYVDDSQTLYFKVSTDNLDWSPENWVPQSAEDIKLEDGTITGIEVFDDAQMSEPIASFSGFAIDAAELQNAIDIYDGNIGDTPGDTSALDAIFAAYSYDIKGGAGPDVLTGGDQSDMIDGGQENETTEDGADNDTLTGGLDSDTFVFNPDSGDDIIVDFSQTEGDLIDLQGYTEIAELADLQLFVEGGSTVISLDGQNSITVLNSASNGQTTLTTNDFLFNPGTA